MSSQKKSLMLTSDTLLKPAVSIALHYGFKPVARATAEANAEGPRPRKTTRPAEPRSSFNGHMSTLHNALSLYVSNHLNRLPQPVLFYHAITDNKSKSSKNESFRLALQVMGSKKSVSEAMLIKTALDILHEAGVRNVCVAINTIGDGESTIRYARELGNFFRKHAVEIPAQAHQLLKKDPIQALAYLYKKEYPVVAHVPSTIESLSESSRNHLREVLEFLESIDIAYEIDASLLGEPNCHTQTVFEIRELSSEDTETERDAMVYVRGGRYDEFGRRLYGTDLPAVAAVFECRRGKKKNESVLEPKRFRQPKVYFIQFGFEAKLRSLHVLEILRRARVPIYQSLGSDKLSGQLQYAERLQIPYTIIMGQKEALEGSVIVRDMNTRSQDTVMLDLLSDYLHKVV